VKYLYDRDRGPKRRNANKSSEMKKRQLRPGNQEKTLAPFYGERGFSSWGRRSSTGPSSVWSYKKTPCLEEARGGERKNNKGRYSEEKEVFWRNEPSSQGREGGP